MLISNWCLGVAEHDKLWVEDRDRRRWLVGAFGSIYRNLASTKIWVSLRFHFHCTCVALSQLHVVACNEFWTLSSNVALWNLHQGRVFLAVWALREFCMLKELRFLFCIRNGLLSQFPGKASLAEHDYPHQDPVHGISQSDDIWCFQYWSCHVSGASVLSSSFFHSWISSGIFDYDGSENT